ncbi:MAG: Uma2 family endonuclease [Actinomycetia bacterium]|nr:Uma2 family endonuclease [Actinomycetes bacterium]
MTALPAQTWPLTVAEYAALPEDPEHRYELQEGAIVMPARPVPDHQDYLGELYAQLRPQVPRHLKMLLEVDLDLHLVPPAHPGTVRVPDLVVVTREAFLRVRREGGLLRAADAVLAVEVHSTSTRRTDTVIKHGEYSDAGIGHYWMIDLLDGPSLTACHAAGAFGYAGGVPARGTFVTEAPFPVRLDLDAAV